MTATTTARPTKVRTSEPPPDAPASLSWRGASSTGRFERLVLAVGAAAAAGGPFSPPAASASVGRTSSSEVGGRVGDRERTGAEGHRLEGDPVGGGRVVPVFGRPAAGFRPSSTTPASVATRELAASAWPRRPRLGLAGGLRGRRDDLRHAQAEHVVDDHDLAARHGHPVDEQVDGLVGEAVERDDRARARARAPGRGSCACGRPRRSARGRRR